MANTNFIYYNSKTFCPYSFLIFSSLRRLLQFQKKEHYQNLCQQKEITEKVVPKYTNINIKSTS